MSQRSSRFLYCAALILVAAAAWSSVVFAAPVPKSGKVGSKLICKCLRYGLYLMHPGCTFGTTYLENNGQMVTPILRPELPDGLLSMFEQVVASEGSDEDLAAKAEEINSGKTVVACEGWGVTIGWPGTRVEPPVDKPWSKERFLGDTSLWIERTDGVATGLTKHFYLDDAKTPTWYDTKDKTAFTACTLRHYTLRSEFPVDAAEFFIKQERESSEKGEGVEAMQSTDALLERP